MNPLDIIDAIGDMDDDLIRLCFDEDDEISPVQEWTEICNHPPSLPKSKQQPLQGNSKPDDTSNSNKKVSGFVVLSHLLTAVCTAACIAGFTILIRSVHSPNDLYTPSGSSEVAVTQPTTVKTAATTVPITVSTVNTTTVTEQTTLETVLSTSEQPEMELLITAETTAQFEIEEITETELTDTVTETVSASTAEVTETTVQTTELEVQKPEPADDLAKKLEMLANADINGHIQIFETMKDNQYGLFSIQEVHSIVVYTDHSNELDMMIEQNSFLNTIGIKRTPYLNHGENCWLITSEWREFNLIEAKYLINRIQQSNYAEVIDINMEMQTNSLSFDEEHDYFIEVVVSLDCELNPMEIFREDLDFECCQSALIDNKYCLYLCMKDPKDYKRIHQIAYDLYCRQEDVLYVNICTMYDHSVSFMDTHETLG